MSLLGSEHAIGSTFLLRAPDAIEWLARYVKQDTAITAGPGFSTVDQNGDRFVSDTYPPTPGTPVTATNGLDVAIDFAKPTLVLGAPKLSVTYKSTA